MKTPFTALIFAEPQNQESQQPNQTFLLGTIAFVILLSVVVLLGWMVNSPVLKSGFPGSPATMKANSALCFLLSGISLGLIQIRLKLKNAKLKKKLKIFSLGALFLILLIAFLTLSEYAFGWNLGIDQALFRDQQPSAASPYPGRMGANTAFNFGLTGMAILLLLRKNPYRSWLAQIIGFTIGLIALLALIGHLFDVNVFQRTVIIVNTMAIHTALGFAALSAIILLTYPEQGFMRSLTSSLIGGLIARRLLPWAIGFPVGVGWLVLQGKKQGWYDSAFMDVIVVMIMTFTFTVLIGWTAEAINQLDAGLRQKQLELEQTNESLESRVAERTVNLLEANERLQIELLERQRAETKLRTIGAVLENAVEGISRIDPQGRYTFVNPAYAHIVGYQPEEMLGMEWQKTVHPDDVEKMIDVYQQMLKEGKVEAEIRGIRKNGSILYKQVVMISAYDEQQKFNGNHCFMKDISDRKRAEEYLRQSEEIHAQLAAIVEASDDALIRKGLDGTILSWNRGAEKIFGYTAEEVVGHSIAMLVPPNHVNEIPQILNRVQQGESVEHYETERLRKDGQRIHISITASPIRDDRGTVIAASVVKRDITDQKRAEAALQQSEARNRALIEALPDLLIQMRSDGTYLDFVSGSNFKLLDLAQFYPGTHINNMMPQDLAQERMIHVQQALATGEVQIYDYEIPIDGNIYVEEARIAPCGKAEVLVIVRDITERKQAEADLRTLAGKLEQSNQELQNFAFVASHDLKEPLRTIRSFSTLLQSRCSSQLSDQGKDYINRMQSAAKRMQTLIDDILSLSRVTSQAQPFVPVDLNQVVKKVLSDLEIKIQETSATVEVGTLPRLEGDPTQIHQLLQNLISNALKFYGDKPPVVKIHSQFIQQSGAKGNPRAEQSCQISVQDEGIGFDEQYSDRIFRIFERLQGRSEYEGTGIGLAICRKIVERHNGSITVQSTPGQGSTFLIALPVKQSA